jgi:uncharacterized membrane protein YidH (DUF202 family)
MCSWTARSSTATGADRYAPCCDSSVKRARVLRGVSGYCRSTWDLMSARDWAASSLRQARSACRIPWASTRGFLRAAGGVPQTSNSKRWCGLGSSLRLQAERTALAWARTALALVAVTLLVARTLTVRFGLWVAVVAVAGSLVAASAMLVADRRYRRWTRPGELPYRAAAPNAALAGVTVLLAAAVLATR